jgi:hypothetical protein
MRHSVTGRGSTEVYSFLLHVLLSLLLLLLLPPAGQVMCCPHVLPQVPHRHGGGGDGGGAGGLTRPTRLEYAEDRGRRTGLNLE